MMKMQIFVKRLALRQVHVVVPARYPAQRLAHRILPAGAAGSNLDVHGESAAILEGILDEIAAPV